jgi:hypothetical protein
MAVVGRSTLATPVQARSFPGMPVSTWQLARGIPATSPKGPVTGCDIGCANRTFRTTIFTSFLGLEVMHGSKTHGMVADHPKWGLPPVRSGHSTAQQYGSASRLVCPAHTRSLAAGGTLPERRHRIGSRARPASRVHEHRPLHPVAALLQCRADPGPAPVLADVIGDHHGHRHDRPLQRRPGRARTPRLAPPAGTGDGAGCPRSLADTESADQ